MSNWLKDAWTRFKADIVKAHKSITIWFNALIAGVAYIFPIAQNSFQNLHGHIPDNFYHWLMTILIVGNVVLRFRTSTPLSAK